MLPRILHRKHHLDIRKKRLATKILPRLKANPVREALLDSQPPRGALLPRLPLRHAAVGVCVRARNLERRRRRRAVVELQEARERAGDTWRGLARGGVEDVAGDGGFGGGGGGAHDVCGD